MYIYIVKFYELIKHTLYLLGGKKAAGLKPARVAKPGGKYGPPAAANWPSCPKWFALTKPGGVPCDPPTRTIS